MSLFRQQTRRCHIEEKENVEPCLKLLEYEVEIKVRLFQKQIILFSILGKTQKSSALTAEAKFCKYFFPFFGTIETKMICF